MKRTAGIILAVCWMAFGLLAASALAGGPPVGNPGSPGDDCSHGNSNQPCKDDPSPNGKDCEDHGKARGNEDHCDAATPPPVLVEVCRSGDPHVFVLAPATGDGTCGTTTEPTTPTETTPTTPDAPKPIDTPVVVTPPTVTPAAKPPVVTKHQLEDALEAQSPSAAVVNAPGHAQSAEELPYTGFPTWLVALLGGLLVATGFFLRGGVKVGRRLA